MIETSLRENAKIIITEHGMSPTLLLGGLPVKVTTEDKQDPDILKYKN